jgi:hypothetical protein
MSDQHPIKAERERGLPYILPCTFEDMEIEAVPMPGEAGESIWEWAESCRPAEAEAEAQRREGDRDEKGAS